MRKVLRGRAGGRKRWRTDEIAVGGDAESSNEDEEPTNHAKPSRALPLSSSKSSADDSSPAPVHVIPSSPPRPTPLNIGVGAALRRNADGTTVQPRTLKRKRKTKRVGPFSSFS